MDYFDQLQRFERFTRRLVEGSFDKIFGGRPVANEVARIIAQAMESSGPNKFAPNQFDVYLQPSAFDKLTEEMPDPEQQLQVFVEQLASEVGLVLAGRPLVILTIADQGQSEIAVVEATNNQTQEESTQAFRTVNKQISLDEIKKKDAFLIVNGKRHIRLDKPMVSIGRHLDNDIVLDDATVSRKHAQIRWRYGRFVIHDVGSRSGILINGIRIAEAALASGDVVKVGNSALIYGEDALRNREEQPNDIHRDGITQELQRPDSS